MVKSRNLPGLSLGPFPSFGSWIYRAPGAKKPDVSGPFGQLASGPEVVLDAPFGCGASWDSQLGFDVHTY
jgi:hypothetical protein